MNLRAAIDTDEAIAVGDHHAHPRVGREIAILEPALRAVHDDFLSVEEVPHHREVRRPVGVDRPDDGEALLFEELSLRGRQLPARHPAAGR
jgi:hypothetical protein